jgi:hypothetical protein
MELGSKRSSMFCEITQKRTFTSSSVLQYWLLHFLSTQSIRFVNLHFNTLHENTFIFKENKISQVFAKLIFWHRGKKEKEKKEEEKDLHCRFLRPHSSDTGWICHGSVWPTPCL